MQGSKARLLQGGHGSLIRLATYMDAEFADEAAPSIACIAPYSSGMGLLKTVTSKCQIKIERWKHEDTILRYSLTCRLFTLIKNCQCAV